MTKHGGKRPGSGRKLVDGEPRDVGVMLRLTATEATILDAKRGERTRTQAILKASRRLLTDER